jgi:RNA polymerase sigma factor (TIGR02999 family)
MSSQPQKVLSSSEARIALDDVFTRLYNKIRLLAARVRWDNANPTLNATTLVHEAYLKLQKNPPDVTSKSYDEIIAIFAHAMRQILIDAARRKHAQKRELCEPPENMDLAIEDAIALDTVFDELAQKDAQLARVFGCRYFLGMTADETAAALAISKTAAERAFHEARLYVANRLRPALVD